MNTDDGCVVAEMLPHEVYEELKRPDTVLVDVRTKAERSFVGAPDLDALKKRVLSIEWLAFPEMSIIPESAGERDDDMHRGNINGWKQRNMPWRQT